MLERNPEMFAWPLDLATGDADIDRDHQQIFASARHLHEAMLAGAAKCELKKAIDHLLGYAKGHFAREERLMRGCQYPQIDAHLAEHAEMQQKVKILVERFEAGEVTMTIELMHLLRAWLDRHVQSTDKALVTYLKQTRQSLP
jgi:hemerythrin